MAPAHTPQEWSIQGATTHDRCQSLPGLRQEGESTWNQQERLQRLELSFQRRILHSHGIYLHTSMSYIKIVRTKQSRPVTDRTETVNTRRSRPSSFALDGLRAEYQPEITHGGHLNYKSTSSMRNTVTLGGCPRTPSKRCFHPIRTAGSPFRNVSIAHAWVARRNREPKDFSPKTPETGECMVSLQIAPGSSPWETCQAAR